MRAWEANTADTDGILEYEIIMIFAIFSFLTSEKANQNFVETRKKMTLVVSSGGQVFWGIIMIFVIFSLRKKNDGAREGNIVDTYGVLEYFFEGDNYEFCNIFFFDV